MHGARTMAKCAIGVGRQATILKIATASDIATTAHAVAMMVLTVFTPTTSAMSLKTVRSILLTPTLNAAIVLPLTMTLMSKGH